MHTTALKLPVTVPALQKPPAVIRVVRWPRPEVRRVSGAALNRPQSKWTVVAAVVLAVILHIAPVAIVEMKLDRPSVEITQTLNNNPIPPSASD